MTMKLIKKTDEYSIYQRGDERYAVKDAARNAVNGEDKVRILLAEGLITVTAAAPQPEPEPEEATEAEAEAEEESADSADAEAADAY